MKQAFNHWSNWWLLLLAVLFVHDTVDSLILADDFVMLPQVSIFILCLRDFVHHGQLFMSKRVQIWLSCRTSGKLVLRNANINLCFVYLCFTLSLVSNL